MTKIAITLDEASAISGIGKTKLYCEIRAGKLTPRKSGRRTVILVDDLKAYLTSLPLANLQAA